MKRHASCKFTEEEEKEITAFYQTNPHLSVREIAPIYNTTDMTIRRCLFNQGIPKIRDGYRYYSDAESDRLYAKYGIQPMAYDDFCDREFGFLKCLFVTKFTHQKFYYCKCECGELCEISRRYLLNGQKSTGVRSCGCKDEPKIGEKSSHWKGGKPICPECGGRTAGYQAEYCWTCLVTKDILKNRMRQRSLQGRGAYPIDERTIIIRLRQTIEYRDWRQDVLERDEYTCTRCGSIEAIEVDHILPVALYPELIYDIDNGRVLCRQCHLDTPTYGGNLRRDKEKVRRFAETQNFIIK